MHDTVKVWNEGYGEYVDIDKNIASLLKELWEMGVTTINSCENNPPRTYTGNENYIWIEIGDHDGYKKFMDVVFDKIDCSGDIYKRAFYVPVDPKNKDVCYWSYDIHIDVFCKHGDYADGLDHNCVCKEIYTSFSVRFPQRDYNFVYNKLMSFKFKIMKHNTKVLTKYYGSKN